jgi:hypothetical protein
MNSKNILVLTVLLATALFFSGCVQEDSTTPASPITGQVTASAPAPEPTAPKTEIKATGFGDVEMTVSPSKEDTIEGIVTITLSNVPEGTGIAAFALLEQGAEMGEDTGAPNLGFDTDGSDGWKRILDTANFENGVYTLAGIIGTTLDEESDGPTGAAMAQVIIDN